MSTPESIVVSYEKALELQKAGFHQGWMGTYFKWFDVRSDYTKGEPVPQVESIYCNYPMIADAPTAEEILSKLPKQSADDNFLTISPEKNGWAVYYETSKNIPVYTYKSDTLANAAASMWIYLSKNNLLPKA